VIFSGTLLFYLSEALTFSEYCDCILHVPYINQT